mgnify:CR=1 FL=1
MEEFLLNYIIVITMSIVSALIAMTRTQSPVEIMARITNISQEQHTIKAGERCVQLVIIPIPDTEYVEDDLSETERGVSGFGSTGRN